MDFIIWALFCIQYFFFFKKMLPKSSPLKWLVRVHEVPATAKFHRHLVGGGCWCQALVTVFCGGWNDSQKNINKNKLHVSEHKVFQARDAFIWLRSSSRCSFMWIYLIGRLWETSCLVKVGVSLTLISLEWATLKYRALVPASLPLPPSSCANELCRLWNWVGW